MATNDFGCVDNFIDTVFVEEGGFTKTPNAFTPGLNGPSGGAEFDPNIPGSGDAANDIFLPITQGVEDFKMYVYDRWGNLIFFSDNKRVGWDGYNSKGVLLPAGVYIYKLDLILSNGQRTTRVGDVTLIR
jgi:gliding motility-associated-like protein